ncbi:MAG: prolyl oligopeptidase family serine peptidase [Gammaproteobacteria bacterium]|nr:prolyl oligopeptidase family serine peptidase [Gammaproteobacteria bacterium]
MVRLARILAIRTATAALAAATIGLVACRGSTTGSSMPMQSSPPQPGQLLQSPTKTGSYTASDLLSLLSGDSDAGQLLKLAFSQPCSVNVYHIQYETVGGQNEATTASGALMVPTGADPSCQGARPIVLYAHGTSTQKTYNIAALTSASGSINDEGVLLAAVFAAKGYIVIAPNYAGYDTSTLSYHPYLVAAQQSHDMMDALAAARSAFSGLGANGSSKLFITGYSQGGYVALATLRAMQAAGQSVTAAGPMSGPYALSAFGDAVFMGEVNGSAVINFTFVVDSYQHSYGNVYTNATDIISPQYANGIGSLLPTTTPNSSLYAQGLLPQNAMFSSTPPAPQYASITPATTPANLAPAFALGFGMNPLVINAYRLSWLQDAQTHPDGGFPTTTTDTPPANAGIALRQDLANNDLRNFNPSAPVLLCGGDNDPTVFYLNTLLMQGYWAAHAPSAQASVLDVDSAVGSNDPYADVKNGFTAAKTAVIAAAIAGGATDGGKAAVLTDYHAGLVPPFCLFAVEKFFGSY